MLNGICAGKRAPIYWNWNYLIMLISVKEDDMRSKGRIGKSSKRW